MVPLDEVRDKRELTRARMALVQQRTQLKQRIHTTLAKYNFAIPEVSDPFGVKGRKGPQGEDRGTSSKDRGSDKGVLLEQVERMEEVLAPSREVELLMTLPEVGFIKVFGDVPQSIAGPLPHVSQPRSCPHHPL